MVLTGRASDMIVTASKKVNPREVEGVILQMDGVRQVKVYGEPAGARGEVVAAAIVGWLQALNISAWTFLLTVNVILLAVGCFLDPLSAILLLTPLLVPLVKAFGIDTVHFGIVVTVNLAIGLFHPPFGMNIFVAQSVLGLELRAIYRGIIPFLVIYLIALVLITYIPAISLGGMRFLLGVN